MIALEEIRELLDRQLDQRAVFSHILRFTILRKRTLRWRDSKLQRSSFHSEDLWALRALHGGVWSLSMAPSFEALKVNSQLPFEMAQHINRRDTPTATHSIMVSKPIRHLAYPQPENDVMPPIEDIQLMVERLLGNQIEPFSANYVDQLYRYCYWDTEGSHGTRHLIGASFDTALFRSTSFIPIGNLDCHHIQNADSPLDLKNLSWASDVDRWRQHLRNEEYQGSNIEGLPWIFTPRAFAVLIKRTLEPTLCLDRPDPFNPNTNPATLENQAIAPPCLNLISDPSILSENSFMDDDGVPARKVTLIEKGVLKNFLFSRLSAFHLSRSLSLLNEKVLAGSSIFNSSNGSIRPKLSHIEVPPRQSLSSVLDESYLRLNDLEIVAVNAPRDKFIITARHSLVSKYGGLHRRHLPRLSFEVSRNQLWSQLEQVGDKSETVSVSHGTPCLPTSACAVFRVPMAQFKGFACRLS